MLRVAPLPSIPPSASGVSSTAQSINDLALVGSITYSAGLMGFLVECGGVYMITYRHCGALTGWATSTCQGGAMYGPSMVTQG